MDPESANTSNGVFGHTNFVRPATHRQQQVINVRVIGASELVVRQGRFTLRGYFSFRQWNQRSFSPVNRLSRLSQVHAVVGIAEGVLLLRTDRLIEASPY